jgi:hypothetical protein
VRRFLLVTSIGTGNSADAPPQQVYDVLKPLLLEKSKAEDRLMVRREHVADGFADEERHGSCRDSSAMSGPWSNFSWSKKELQELPCRVGFGLASRGGR